MSAVPENTWLNRRLFLFLAGSIIMLVVYYAGYRPVPTYSKHQSAYSATFPTIVAFQRETINAKGNCTSPQPPVVLTYGWQKLDPNWYLYSAYLDSRTATPLIRIVALSEGDPGAQLLCRTWPNGTLSQVHKTELWVRAWDSTPTGRYLHPYLLSCSASVNVSAVSVVIDPCQKPTNLLNVTSSRHQKRTKQFAMCLKPMDFDQDITPRIIEWLELQFLLGADSILVYAHHLHSGTRRVLEHYAEKVTIVDHIPPANTQQTNWTYLWQRRRLEVALYNDCFYRHIISHRYVINLDLDEAIVPLAHNTWADLLEGPTLLQSASISVRNVYFFDSLGVDPSVPAHLHMLRHVYRSANFTPPGFAQKSFFSTQYAEAVAHHYALRALLRPGGTRLMSGLNLQQARLHHYRSQCPALMMKQCTEDFMRYRVRDIALWRFRKSLESAVAGTMQELGMDIQNFAENFTVIE